MYILTILRWLNMLKKNMKKTLTQREYNVVSKRYGLENQRACTQQEVADEMGISRSYVSRIEKKALKKLNSALNG